jgi:hypothetical protein
VLYIVADGSMALVEADDEKVGWTGGTGVVVGEIYSKGAIVGEEDLLFANLRGKQMRTRLSSTMTNSLKVLHRGGIAEAKVPAKGAPYLIHIHYTLYTHYTLTIHSLYTTHYTLTIHYTLYTIHYTLTIHSLYTHYTLYTIHYTLYTHYTLTIHSLYTIHYTLYTHYTLTIHSLYTTGAPYRYIAQEETRVFYLPRLTYQKVLIRTMKVRIIHASHLSVGSNI